jgi:phage terminase small subunit
MPRKSAASLSVVASIDQHRERLRAPMHLPDGVKAIFEAVVGSVSATHIRPCDEPLVEALAVAVDTHRKARAAVDREGLVVDGRVNAHVAIIDRTSKLIASLSTKLKISPTGRLDRNDVGKTTRFENVSPVVDHNAAIDRLLDEEEE